MRNTDTMLIRNPEGEDLGRVKGEEPERERRIGRPRRRWCDDIKADLMK
jgi:hypothetical protein